MALTAVHRYLDVKLQSITEVLQSSTQTEKDKQQDDDKLAAQVSPNRFSEALRAKAAELAIPFDEGDSRTWTTRSSHRNESKSLMFNRAPTPPDMLQIGGYDVLVSSPWEE